MKHSLIISACILYLACLTNSQSQTVWQKDTTNPVIPNWVGGGYAFSPTVLYDSSANIYKMWFTTKIYGGPWSVYYALSTDGINWFSYVKNPVLEGGSASFESEGVVYCGVVYDGTEYKMYYSGVHGCCAGAIGLATSPDGIHWTKYAGNPVLTPSSSGWDARYVSAPEVYFKDSTYFMYYLGHDGTYAQTGLATSPDGIYWTKHPSNPVLTKGDTGSWDEGMVAVDGLLIHEGIFYAFYSGCPNGGKCGIGLATSSDGISWTKYSGNPVLVGGDNATSWDWTAGGGTVVLKDNVLQMWYSGTTQNYPRWSVGYATSQFSSSSVLTNINPPRHENNSISQRSGQNFYNPYVLPTSDPPDTKQMVRFHQQTEEIIPEDVQLWPLVNNFKDLHAAHSALFGEHSNNHSRKGLPLFTTADSVVFDWQKDATNPVIPNWVGGGYAFAPSVLFDNETHTYRMWLTTKIYGGPWSIYHAISTNGRDWFSYIKNPVLERGTLSFETEGAVYCSVLYDGSQYRMYYTGVSGCCGEAIGLATSPDGITWTRYSGNPILSPSATGWDSLHIAGPKIYFDGSTYFMYYAGTNGIVGQTGLATSTDGIVWTKHPSNPILSLGEIGAWDDNGNGPAALLVHQGTWYLFYNSGYPDKSGEGVALSNDGIAWTKYSANPIMKGDGSASWDSVIGGGTVLLVDDTLRQWFSGSTFPYPHWSVGYATSPFISSPIHEDTTGFSISGEVFFDKNQNGIKDEDEPGLGGRLIELFQDSLSETPLDTVRTHGNGIYHLLIPSAGTYYVKEDLRGHWHRTFPPTDGYLIELVTPKDTSGFDFGIYNRILTVHMSRRWNMISLPLTVEDPRKETLFPHATSDAFAFNQTGYYSQDIILPRLSYWLKYPTSMENNIEGEPRFTDSIDVSAGWNMIGSIANSILATAITSIPGGMITSNFFGYEGRYVVANTIEPGSGYWVKVNQSGKLILSSSSSLLAKVAANRINIVPTSELPPPPPGALYDENFIPIEFSLEQNYPNPFNPSTTISFELVQDALVTITVYNIIGQEVATLANKQEFSEGNNQVQFNASYLASGVYYYKIVAEDMEGKEVLYSNVKKMILVK